MREEKLINLETVVSQIEIIDATDLNGEKVMMNLDKGQYYALNEVASRIWEIIESPKTINQVVCTLLGEYYIDSESCKEAVFEFIESMKNAEIIQVS